MNMLPYRDYACCAAFCDDAACNMHGTKDVDGNLLYWIDKDTILEELQGLQDAFWDKARELENALGVDIEDLCTRDLAGLTIEDLLD
jgi:hypothetical protein